MHVSLNKLKPYKILGKGTQGLIISTYNNKYTVKIYDKIYLNSSMFINIVEYLQKNKSLPLTIYKSYFFTINDNSFERYIKNNGMPEYFSLKEHSNGTTYNKTISPKLFEIMKTYKMTLKEFLKDFLKEHLKKKLRENILKSLFQQGLITLVWLYINKGIIHNDISYDNFFIQKTSKKNIKFNIYNKEYNIKLFGYYLIIGDFGYAKSIEFIHFENYIKNSFNSKNIRYELNPLNDIYRFLMLFKKTLKKSNIKINNDYKDTEKIARLHSKMLESYYKSSPDLDKNIKIYKKNFFHFINIEILNYYIY
jgi:hypothetical protein